MTRPALVPELTVTDLAVSLRFWCGIAGFAVLYDRPEEGFACIERDGARLMLDTLGMTRDWLAAAIEYPFGRGMNIEITLPDIAQVQARAAKAGLPFFLQPEVKRYRVGGAEVQVRQFILQDPDGYLVRFAQEIRVPAQ